MKVRSCWTDVPVPEHTTSDEVVTVPNDSSTIQELFERAARGESINGSYDEFEDDSIFDDVHDPDMQDPLLREANKLNKLDDVIVQTRDLVTKRQRAKRENKTSSQTTPGSGSGNADESENSESDT